MRKSLALGVLLGGMAVGLTWIVVARRPPTASAQLATDQASEPAARPAPRLDEETLKRLRDELQARPPAASLPSVPNSPLVDQDSRSPREGRDRQVERLRASGPDRRSLLEPARRVGAAWVEAVAQKKLDVKFGEWECFHAGCFVNARHGSAALVDRVTEEVTMSPAFHEWNGEKIRTGPVEEKDGKTDVTWVLLPPHEGEPALQSGVKVQAQNESSSAPEGANARNGIDKERTP